MFCSGPTPSCAKGRVSACRFVLLQLFDGRLVETVGIPADADGGGRLTVCVSSQVVVLTGRTGHRGSIAGTEAQSYVAR